MLACVQVDRRDAAVRRLPQWQTGWMTRSTGARAIGITRRSHTGGRRAAVGHVAQICFFTGQQLNRAAGALRGHEHNASLGITCSRTGDVGTTTAAWTPERTTLAEIIVTVQRWVVERANLPVVQSGDRLSTHFRGEIDQIVFGQTVEVIRKRFGRERLGRRSKLARDM